MQGVNQFLCKDLIYVSLTKANEHGMISQNMLLEMRIAHHTYFVLYSLWMYVTISAWL